MNSLNVWLMVPCLRPFERALHPFLQYLDATIEQICKFFLFYLFFTKPDLFDKFWRMLSGSKRDENLVKKLQTRLV